MAIKEKVKGMAVRISSKENMVGKAVKYPTLRYYRKKFYDKFYSNHFYACTEILDSFLDKCREDKNHTVLYAPTQSGKTTCMTLLTNMISDTDYKYKLNLKFIIYLTGDNQCGLFVQSKDTFDEQTKNKTFIIEDDKETSADEIDDTVNSVELCQKNGEIPILFMKQSDCKKAVEMTSRHPNFFKNVLIMIDESHYGTKNKKSQVNKFLTAIGCDLANSPKKLVSNNVYILSVSATPWNELFSDKHYGSDKKTIRYKTGENYKGICEFVNNDNIIGLDKGINTMDDFSAFLKKQRKKIERIGENIGKAIIFRLNDKNLKFPEKELKKIISDNGFDSFILSSKTSKIDYNNVDNAILAADKKGKPLAIMIYEGYKHGIRINGIAKKEIVTAYDFRKSDTGDAIDATEQGLMGRMCGYDDIDLKNLEIYINSTHYDGLLNHNDGRETTIPSTVISKADVVECSKDEWKKQPIPEGKDRFDYILVKREKNISFVIDSFLNEKIKNGIYDEKNINNLLTNFSSKPKRGLIAGIIKDFVKEKVENGEINVDLLPERLIEGRRYLKTKDSFIETIIGKGKYIHNNNNRAVLNSEKKVDNGQYVWGGVINSIHDGKASNKNVELIIAYGKPVYVKQEMRKKSVDRKLHAGYKPEKVIIAKESRV